jgi:crossover junction endodeoxyribonuclease RuvC
MRVLGLDPGSQSTGFGLVESRGGEYAVLGWGTIKPGRSLALAQRVNTIRNHVDSLIAQHQPQEAAIENPFYAQNIKTAITGYGQADKHQVQGMVRALLHMGDEPLEEDASDALATAICHLNSRSFHKTVEESSL